MSLERVQKLLAQAGLASRREAEQWIEAGRVTVNGAPVKLGDRADLKHDVVKVDGKRLARPAPRRYLLLNKPRGYLTTRHDPDGRPTVFDLLPVNLRPGLQAVGRLDFQTEGLLLLTDDGDLAQRVSHPSHGGVKTYAVKVKGVPSVESIRCLRKGVFIDGRRTLPARIVRRPGAKRQRAAIANSWWTVALKEGRNRQIREMFFRVGHPVLKLRRTGIGGLTDPRLPMGQFRELTSDEVVRLQGGPSESAPVTRQERKASGWATARRRRRSPGGRTRSRQRRRDDDR